MIIYNLFARVDMNQAEMGNVIGTELIVFIYVCPNKN